MDQAALVINQIDDGRKLLDRLRSRNFDFVAAFWLKRSDEEPWSLYLATSKLDDDGIQAAYRALVEAAQSAEELWVDVFDVTLIGAAHPMVADVLRLRKNYPAKIPTRYRGARLGGVSIDEAYIYPAFSASATP